MPEPRRVVALSPVHNFFSDKEQESILVVRVETVTAMVNGQLMRFEEAILGWNRQGPVLVKADNLSRPEPNSILALEKCFIVYAQGLLFHASDKAIRAVWRVFFPHTTPTALAEPLEHARFAHAREQVRMRVEKLARNYGLKPGFGRLKQPRPPLALQSGLFYLVPEGKGVRVLRRKTNGLYVHSPFSVCFARPAELEFARRFVIEVPRLFADPLAHGCFLVSFLKFSTAKLLVDWRARDQLVSVADPDWTPRLESCVPRIPFIHVVPRPVEPESEASDGISDSSADAPLQIAPSSSTRTAPAAKAKIASKAAAARASACLEENADSRSGFQRKASKRTGAVKPPIAPAKRDASSDSCSGFQPRTSKRTETSIPPLQASPRRDVSDDSRSGSRQKLSKRTDTAASTPFAVGQREQAPMHSPFGGAKLPVAIKRANPIRRTLKTTPLLPRPVGSVARDAGEQSRWLCELDNSDY